ncbi:OmpA family protein [Pseudoflavitalea sp. X16]|uniref:OmpA family protein n=1 Tax=Paraflavitalea devenefica TaxID=2716334 RepID=UPI0014247B84|nr:OmpA family protein [Paraflavitalea devenefica]NII29619.1 OmpA family protein [Paraflavitalea devenefica]
MKPLQNTLTAIVAASILLGGCKSMNKTQKGAVIGTAGGAVVGGVIGKAAGNTALGAIIGATVGGVGGALIGKKMDKQAKEIENRVPGAKVERVGEGIVVEFSEKILFGYDRSDLSSSAEGNLDKLVSVLKEYPDTNIEVQGHTDSKGSDSYNQGLSQRRASAVATYLRNRGVSSSRITTKGYGESAPVATNDTDDGRAQNRRVNFLITANEKMKQDAQKEAQN